MTTTQDTIADTTRPLQIWADSVKKFVGSLPISDGRVPSTMEVVDNYFDFLEHILETQRDFIKSMIPVIASVATSATTAAQDDAKKNPVAKMG
ncbi:MAG TPA: hypothetical protein VJT72_16710 [Pseudonocardiaceae bacterium]|nr:hypothetical protein [Pseudonocardiaceae bacterium]